MAFGVCGMRRVFVVCVVLRCALLHCGVMWFDLVWFGLVWFGLVWSASTPAKAGEAKSVRDEDEATLASLAPPPVKAKTKAPSKQKAWPKQDASGT